MKSFFSRKMLAICLMLISLSLASCISTDISQSQKEIVDSELKDKSEYFDFSTKQTVQVRVDYKRSTKPVNVFVYTENPYNEFGELDTTLHPVYSAYTTETGLFEAIVTTPSDVERLYITTAAAGFPLVLSESTRSGLPIENNTIVWSAQDASVYSDVLPIAGSATTRIDLDEVNIDSHVNSISGANLYTLYDTYDPEYYIVSNSQVPNLYSQYTDDFFLTPQSTLGEMVGRINSTLYDGGRKLNNSAYVQGSDVVNFKILDTTSDNKKVEAAQIDLVFLNSGAGFSNSMAYYYYPSDQVMTKEDLQALPKYLIFPRINRRCPAVKIASRIQFFGANYDEPGVDAFPPGYTIGWMLVANVTHSDKYNPLDKVNSEIASTYLEGTKCIYSNEIANNIADSSVPAYEGQPLPGCIALFDEQSESIVIGFEDLSYKNNWGDASFEDVLFFAACTPVEAIETVSNNVINTTNEPATGSEWNTSTEIGTLAFEDLWPSQGDYDLNDMVLEYKTTISYNQDNKIRRIVDEFTPVYDGASFNNAFGIIIDETMGTLDIEGSDFAVKEAENRFILWTNNKQALESGKSYKVVRTWDEGSYLDRADRQTRNINPFLVVKYEASNRNRSEVHLPMTTASPWGDTSLNNTSSDAYYVDRSGAFPFAIDLYNVVDWTVNTVEQRRIDDSRAYPRFATWASSNGTKDQDWYK